MAVTVELYVLYSDVLRGKIENAILSCWYRYFK